MSDFQFLPSKTGAVRTNRRMHDGLFTSLAYLAEVMSEQDPALTDRLTQWRKGLGKNARLSPAVFGAYYDVVDALEAEDNDRAFKLFERILAAPAEADQTRICVLGRDYDAIDGARIQAYMGRPETDVAGVTAPDAEAAERFTAKLRHAIDWIERHLPGLGQEMNELVREITLVGPVEGSNLFEGGTCFRLWGAVALNCERRASYPDLIATLAHEEGHAALFGACRDEMLVENPDSEMFYSPIRGRARPLEGIFHASFVSARMVWALKTMLDSDEFSPMERQRIATDLENAYYIYSESADIVCQNARLTPTGAAVLEAMTDFMSKPDYQLQFA